jgi:hypothetical protein
MAVNIQLRRGTAAEWTLSNPTLTEGEVGVETDTKKLKVGDGLSVWSSLPYINLTPAAAASIYAPIANPTFTGTVGGVTKSMVGLGSVDNTTDANKPVSTATQTALNLKAPLASPDLTGTPTAPTATAGTATTQIATTAFVGTAVSNLVASAPGALDTLNELATALGNDASFSTTVTNALAAKAPLASPTFTGTVSLDTGVSLVFEGSTANAFETTLAVEDPTADRTITFPDATGTVALVEAINTSLGSYVETADIGEVSGVAGLDANKNLIIPGASIIIEGATDNTFETTLTVTDPTADRTLTLPNETGTLATQEWSNSIGINHTSATTSVHGIADTAQLATKQYADTAAGGAVTTAGTAADTKISTHNSDTTEVHGIADTSVLTTASNTQTLTGKTLTSPKINENVALTATSTTLNYVATATSDIQTQLNNKQAIVADVSDTEIGYLNGVTSAIQTQLNNKQPIVANVSDVEIGYLDGVTSSIQTQMDAKAPLASPTFTGTVTLPANTISQSMMGDDSVGTNEIGGLAVTTEKIAALAVTEGKIADSAVTSAKIADGTIVNADINASAAIAQSKVADLTTDLAAKAPIASPTFTGTVTLAGAPTSDLHAATKLYVDNVTAGINFHAAVHAASVNNLAVIYNNGTSGVGATLTADTNRAFSTLDGESVVLNERVLIKNQTDARQNGIYTLTTAGSVSVPWVLTRATDADNNPTGELKNGDFTFVQRGTVNASIGFINNSATNPIVIGTDNITYTEFNAGKGVVAGNGLAEATPGTLSIDTAITATKASVDLKAPIDAPTFTNLVTVAASGVAFTDGTQTKEGVPSRTPIIQKTASYTLSALTERDDLIEMASGSAMTLTIPADSTLDFPIGTSLDILQTSTGQVTIAGAGGVTVNSTPGLKLRTTWSSATLFKRAANTWVVFGDLTA